MWFITVFEKREINHLGWPEYGCRRTWGYYHDHNTALQALHENWTDMWETMPYLKKVFAQYLKAFGGLNMTVSEMGILKSICLMVRVVFTSFMLG